MAQKQQGLEKFGRLIDQNIAHAHYLTALATFAAAGLVAWPQAVVMMTTATLGGYLGAPVARALPAWMLRAGVIAVGAAMSAAFFWRLVA